MDETVYKQAGDFLDQLYCNISLPDDRPFVTLTFAQSLDGKIAKQGQQVLISGKESMAMTHRLRILHDGILVGIGTALIDDPQLNARYLSASETSIKQPQPIVLDPSLRLSPDCKLVKNYANGTGKQPWLIVSEKYIDVQNDEKSVLENAGVKIIPVKASANGRLPFKEVFRVLKSNGIEKLMIEGGSQIIQSCLKDEWDQLIITTGPMFIGSDGVSAIKDNNDMPTLKNIKYQIMGKDSVMAATK
ncbi:dihydrofolate reductase-like domain-containing protein [Parasitella parasitica]|nr:dihydrofolate reductase-like domain-containing protein [Parasitella parasitica]